MDLGQVRRTYTKEFKEKTIGLVLNRGMRVSQVSKDLSIGTETIYRDGFANTNQIHKIVSLGKDI